MTDLSNHSDALDDVAGSLANTSKESTTGSSAGPRRAAQVAHSAGTMSATIQTVAAGAEEPDCAAGRLAEMSGDLHRIVDRFQL